MAHKKGEGSTQNGRDSNSKRLGVKLFGGQAATAGSIIVRQRGTKFHAGDNVYLGKDYTLHAGVPGTVSFRKGRNNRTYVNITPYGEAVKSSSTQSPAPSPAPVAPTTSPDDLRKIEGIGPKIAGLLQDAGIHTYGELAAADLGQLQAVLEAAGPRYKMHDPATWSRQASLAAAGNWDELKQLQEELKGGKEA
ncbi:MAG: hypothetical protein RLY31_2482 [Bacteroidota bacterium]|jgi:large subunit ribosomal protein L27